ncbi:hypothetical protein ABT214_26785, partial [Micromonospora purpureochromogenes]
MSRSEERPDGRYVVPLTVAGPDGQPARSNGHRRTTAAAAPESAALAEPDTSATDEPIPSARAGATPSTSDEPGAGADEPGAGADELNTGAHGSETGARDLSTQGDAAGR